MASWTFKTFTQAKADLALRLSDSGKVFYIDAELGLWWVEALRTWNAAAQFFRNRAQFATTAGQTFYDLTNTTDCGAGSTNPPAFLGYALTDRDVINQLQYNLIEPITTNWTLNTPAMTDMFTAADLRGAVERRRDQFLLELGPVLTHSVVPGPTPNSSGRLGLTDTIIDVRRAAWQDGVSLAWTQLWRTDEFAANSFQYGWAATPGTPSNYSVYLVPHVGLQLVPPNDVAGNLDLITINAAPALDPVTGVLLTIPDDFGWAIRFGALADLLDKDGQARDPFRAKYCATRWDEGLQLAKLGATLQTASLNGLQTPIQSFHDADAYSAGWQNQSGVPTALLNDTNLIALTPTPDSSGPYSVELDMVVNAPVPSAAGDFIQLGREQYDACLGYAQHLAAFKMGGAEFAMTIPLLDQFYALAMEHNDRLRAQAHYFKNFQERSQREERDRPRREVAA